jgi:hypothetical protein
MSTTYAGGITKNIQSSTNATPIAVTTTASHGFTTGDVVIISGHLTNTNANGRFAVTVTGAATFTLDHSVGNGVGGATGTVSDDSYATSATIPSDGDDMSAASVDVSIEALLDRTNYLARRMQPLGLQSVTYEEADGGTTGGSGSETDLFSVAAVETSTGDVLEITISGTLQGNRTGGSGTKQVLFYLKKNVNGGSFSTIQSGILQDQVSTTGPIDVPLSLSAIVNVGTTPGQIIFKVTAYTGDANVTATASNCNVIVKNYRPQT